MILSSESVAVFHFRTEGNQLDARKDDRPFPVRWRKDFVYLGAR